MNPKRIHYLTLAISLTLACNAVTIVTESSPVPPPTILPLPTWTYLPPLPSQPTSTFTPTPTMATVSTAAACRTGPAETFDLVIDLQPGQKFEVVGKATGFWIVKTSDGRECWVNGQFVTIEGETAGLPDRVPPPAPTLGPPAAPKNLALARRKCTPEYSKSPPIIIIGYDIDFTLTWQDMSNNEDGFYVYRDFDKVGELPANTTQAIDTFSIRSGGKSWYYYVVAYNSAGESQSEGLSLGNPCY